jgi:protein-tyrosine phosphatase
MHDIHCHLLPGLDDGPTTWDESLAMARLAVESGTQTVIVTPHQLGTYRDNSGNTIRQKTMELRQRLNASQIPLKVLPGGDVRIEPELASALRNDHVLTLGDHGRHVLLELPHELYFPLEPLLQQLARQQLVGILSHPERNLGILAAPECLAGLVKAGCLMQLTAGSFLGNFGRASQVMSERMLREGLVHFVASDGHGMGSRRPCLAQAFQRVTELSDLPTAIRLFVSNPSLVCDGQQVPCAAIPPPPTVHRFSLHWLQQKLRRSGTPALRP